MRTVLAMEPLLFVVFAWTVTQRFEEDGR